MVCIFIIEKLHPIKENVDSFGYSKEERETEPIVPWVKYNNWVYFSVFLFSLFWYTETF